MNIVKIKDAHVPADFTDEEKVVFSYVKDKYCYLINWKWIVPFEYTVVNKETEEESTFTFSNEQYIECSINNHAPVDNYPYAEYVDYISYQLVDSGLTEKANSIVRFVEANNSHQIVTSHLKNLNVSAHG